MNCMLVHCLIYCNSSFITLTIPYLNLSFNQQQNKLINQIFKKKIFSNNSYYKFQSIFIFYFGFCVLCYFFKIEPTINVENSFNDSTVQFKSNNDATQTKSNNTWIKIIPNLLFKWPLVFIVHAIFFITVIQNFAVKNPPAYY